MRFRAILALLVIALLAIPLAACGAGESATSTSAPTSTAAVETTTEASDTVSTQGSSTTATIAEGAVTAQSIVSSMKAAGLPTGDVESYDENTDPNELLGRPNQYVEKVNFADTELETPSVGDGTVEVFTSSDDAKTRKDYVDIISEGAPMVGYYTYQSDEYLLRITFDIPPTRAAAYEAGFLKAVEGN